MRNKRKNISERGITLVALVVTIIVLLILAAISINIALGNGGLIQRAKDAKGTYVNAEKQELAILDEYGDYLIEYTGDYDNLDGIEITQSNQNLVRIS